MSLFLFSYDITGMKQNPRRESALECEANIARNGQPHHKVTMSVEDGNKIGKSNE